jgi:hypothetical protein
MSYLGMSVFAATMEQDSTHASQEEHMLVLGPHEAPEEDPELSEAAVSIVDERRHDDHRQRRLR